MTIRRIFDLTQPAESKERVIPVAVAYVRPMGDGGAEAHLLQFDDGRRYVVKFLNNREGLLTPANQLLVSRLAEFLEVSCPREGVVQVPRQLIEAEPRLRRSDGQRFESGYCFGSEYHLGIDDPGAATLALASNIEDLAGIVLLDTLCANEHRERDQGNLLLATESGQHRVMAIDHGHCFGHRWDAAIALTAQRVRVVCRPAFVALIQPQHFDPFLDRLRRLDQQALDRIYGDLGSLWGLTSDRLAALKRYLLARRSGVEQAIRERWPKAEG